MNIKRLFNKLLENKNFYYVILALTLIHLLLYAYRGSYKAISFLILSAIIIYNFNKKPVLVLLLSLIATHFFVAGNSIYEGLENKEINGEIKNDENINKLKDTDPELAKVAAGVSNGTITGENAQKVAEKKKEVATNVSSKIKDPNNPETTETTETTEPVPESFEGGKKGTVRLDHAATIETAYDDLQNILGSDGINKLTQDTQKLISQQKNLFTTMEQLAPAVKETMSMLEGMDMKGIVGMSESANSVASKLQNLMKTNNVKASNDKSVK
jgi:hypothetical protein